MLFFCVFSGGQRVLTSLFLACSALLYVGDLVAEESESSAALRESRERRVVVVNLPTSRVADATACGPSSSVVWRSQFSDEFDGWGAVTWHWGQENVAFRTDPMVPGRVLRVLYPAGTWDPQSMRKLGLATGGAQYLARVLDRGLDCAFFRYRVRFEPDFNFVKGGKLPGLFGGRANSGGHIPNGRDGFSTRYMWGAGGRGQVYAYLPTSVKWGTPLGWSKFFFRAGVWHAIQQQVVLNTPGTDDGVVRVWLDGQLAFEQRGLRFRDVDTLKIDGVMFSTFFGGNDASWATPRATYSEFADFAISTGYIP